MFISNAPHSSVLNSKKVATLVELFQRSSGVRLVLIKVAVVSIDAIRNQATTDREQY